MKAFYCLSRLLVPVFLLVAGGCASTPEQIRSGAIAAVEVRDCDEEKLRLAVRSAFEADGYQLKPGRDALVFEKPGGFVNGLVFGAWDKVTVRAKVKLEGADDGPWLVSTDVFMVQSAGQTVFEEERKMGSTHRSTYQRLLEEVKRRVQTAEPAR